MLEAFLREYTEIKEGCVIPVTAFKRVYFYLHRRYPEIPRDLTVEIKGQKYIRDRRWSPKVHSVPPVVFYNPSCKNKKITR